MLSSFFFYSPVPTARSRYRFALLISAAFFIFASVPASALANENDPKKMLREGDKLMRQGKVVDAENLYRQALSVSPDSTVAKLKIAYSLIKQRRLVEAYELSLGVAQADRRNARAYALAGTSLLSLGQFNEARSVLTEAIRLDNNESLAWYSIGLLDYYENRIEESLANLREAVFHDPRDTDAVFSLAQVAARSEKYKEAADAYRRFLQISRNTDDERRDRIQGLIDFLEYLGSRTAIYTTSGPEHSALNFTLIGNRPVLEVRVNEGEEPLRFVLDTGSGITVISDETAERLKIKPVARGGKAKGLGGDGRFEIVYGFLRSVEIGEMRVRNVPVYIRKFHNPTLRFDGYIGLSLISKFLTTVDYGKLEFALTRKDSELAKAIPLENAVPLRLTSSGFLSGEVQLEGVEAPLNFIVDTGASVSVISDEIASVESVSPGLRDERMRVIGSAGITEDVPSYMLPKLSFADHTRSDVMAIALDLDIINEASGFTQAGILGGNFLRNFRMTFDFKNSRVAFAPVKEAQ